MVKGPKNLRKKTKTLPTPSTEVLPEITFTEDTKPELENLKKISNRTLLIKKKKNTINKNNTNVINGADVEGGVVPGTCSRIDYDKAPIAPGAGVVVLKDIPSREFHEREIKTFMRQFGEINRVKLLRSMNYGGEIHSERVCFHIFPTRFECVFRFEVSCVC